MSPLRPPLCPRSRASARHPRKRESPALHPKTPPALCPRLRASARHPRKRESHAPHPKPALPLSPLASFSSPPAKARKPRPSSQARPAFVPARELQLATRASAKPSPLIPKPTLPLSPLASFSSPPAKARKHSTAITKKAKKSPPPNIFLEKNLQNPKNITTFATQKPNGPTHTTGVLAHLARARHWQCRGERFESAILHHPSESKISIRFFVISAPPHLIYLFAVSSASHLISSLSHCG